jgi:hypothetical protein
MNQLQKQLAMTIAAIALGGASAASQAHQGPVETKKDSAACESARLSAWFERQRQLTEGVTDPVGTLPTPDACAGMVASSDVEQAAQAQRVVKTEKSRDER